MLERTFIHAQGIGAATERRLWCEGADSWNAYLADPGRFSLPRGKVRLLTEVVARSPEALRSGDVAFFRERLPQREHWRALYAFPRRVAYLDIETDGGAECDSVTVIGLSDGRSFRQFVRGENLLDFEEALSEFAVLVTYSGSGFDLPVLRNTFPRLGLRQIHIDLCPTLRRLGFTGGLKAIEREVGITRAPEIAQLGGFDTLRLWREWTWGSQAALDLLLAYNREDVVNLQPLARLAFRVLESQCLGPLP